jgi:hypothetical protein
MNSENLAILITPCIIWTYVEDPFKELIDFKHLIKSIKFMIEKYNLIFGKL